MIPLSNEQHGRLIAATHSAVRAVVGVLFACHGAAGMFGVLGGIRPNGGTVPFGLWPLWWVCLFSLVGGTLIAVGLYTRVTAALCAVMMAYLYVTMHMQHALLPTRTGGEPAALYTLIFILVASVGPGSYAIDTVIRQRRRASEIRRYLDTGNVVGISISD